MSKALEAFESSIKDAEELLAIYKGQPKTSPDAGEVLKRAGLVMAMTAWETYVEDRVREEIQVLLKLLNGSHAGQFILDSLEEELKRFHNPTADKTRRLFLDYLKVDVTAKWEWNNCEPKLAKTTLDELMGKRGDAVHRSRAITRGEPAPHPVKKEDLEKAIRFLRNLVLATDNALA
ncbi:RiboL-PSP-HEPN [compost metagenome]